MIAKEQQISITGPLALSLSDKNVASMTAMKPAILGGTVKSCAFIRLYPRLDMIVGRKSEYEYILF